MCSRVFFSFRQGFERVYDSMDDIILDIPHAYRVLGHFVDKCARAGVITLALRDKAPTRYDNEHLNYHFQICTQRFRYSK